MQFLRKKKRKKQKTLKKPWRKQSDLFHCRHLTMSSVGKKKNQNRSFGPSALSCRWWAWSLGKSSTLKKNHLWFIMKKQTQRQKGQRYSPGRHSARACSRRCSPSPGTCCSPRQEDGASLTPAGSRSSVQPPGLCIRSEDGVTETAMGRPPSLESLGIRRGERWFHMDENQMMKETKMA